MSHTDDYVKSPAGITGGLDSLGNPFQRELLRNNGFQIPSSAGHDRQDIVNILREVSAGADDTFLCIGHMQKVDLAGLVVYGHNDISAVDFSMLHKRGQNTLRTGGIDPAVNVRSMTCQGGRSRCF